MAETFPIEVTMISAELGIGDGNLLGFIRVAIWPHVVAGEEFQRFLSLEIQAMLEKRMETDDKFSTKVSAAIAREKDRRA